MTRRAYVIEWRDPRTGVWGSVTEYADTPEDAADTVTARVGVSIVYVIDGDDDGGAS